MKETTLYLFDFNKYKTLKNICDYVIVESLYDHKNSFIVSKTPYLYVYENEIEKKSADVIMMLTTNNYHNVLLVNVFIPFNRNALLKLKTKTVDFAIDIYTVFVPMFQNHSVVCFIIKTKISDDLIVSFLHDQLTNIFPEQSYKIIRINHVSFYTKYII